MPKKTTNPYITVKKSKIHSTGVFAKKKIKKGTRVIEYVGEKVTKAEAEKRAVKPLNRNSKNREYGAVYIFDLNKRYDIDGYVSYNTARYINHSCDPNCESEIIKGKIYIIAIRDIKKSEELSYNYGYAYEDYEDHPCACKTDKCVGYILAEEHWPKLKRKEKAKKKKRKKNKKGKK